MRHLGVSWANTNLPRPLVAVLSDLSQDSCMAMTPKVAVAALLVASLTAGCGASAEEKETACWAQREAIAAEMQAIAAEVQALAALMAIGSPSLANRWEMMAYIRELHESMPGC